jgi:selenocysteine-specific elongation factor
VSDDGEDCPRAQGLSKNVLAGLWGIVASLLVAAAEDDWMPRTEVHFQVPRSLVVKHRVAAIRKKLFFRIPDSWIW